MKAKPDHFKPNHGNDVPAGKLMSSDGLTKQIKLGKTPKVPQN